MNHNEGFCPCSPKTILALVYYKLQTCVQNNGTEKKSSILSIFLHKSIHLACPNLTQPINDQKIGHQVSF